MRFRTSSTEGSRSPTTPTARLLDGPDSRPAQGAAMRPRRPHANHHPRRTTQLRGTGRATDSDREGRPGPPLKAEPARPVRPLDLLSLNAGNVRLTGRICPHTSCRGDSSSWSLSVRSRFDVSREEFVSRIVENSTWSSMGFMFCLRTTLAAARSRRTHRRRPFVRESVGL